MLGLFERELRSTLPSVQYPGNTVPVKPLPVIAYIHGGGYLRGGADLYDGSFLIEQLNQGVILIVMQYRLGLFGFLAGDEVKKIGALNAGLLDQAFAFRWVREHISKFGGDPEQVTIWGKSAGADSVLQHVIAEDGETKPQLFRAAIASSPFLPTQYKYNDRNPRTLYNQVVEQTNCAFSADSLACLRKADTQALQAANMNVSMAGFYGTYMFVPVVDGKYVRQRPTEASKQGKVNGKGLYTVANAHEGDIYVNNATTPLSAGEYTSQLFPTLGSKEAAQVDRLYKDLGNPLQQENLIYGETIFICPAYFLLNAFKSTSFKGE
ncbi:hypothetical protein E1B28_006572 [Marasmius oreades]|uniref:Carboxylic ester hydrolase n=1 Tax=Marasmius oreades TaxID=181124 RepID=A0A9P7UVP7_9AGAR|nr:uncharacterized protein E1B28_006572 [Marasmius oreades]KAG7095883.1 hypothetical protein E1B28_006572 [Marasmius oreades]